MKSFIFLWFFCFFSYFFSFSLLAQSIEFKKAGKLIRALELRTIEKELSPGPKKVFEPHEEKERVYFGVVTHDLLDLVYGKNWRHSEEILFTCADGFRPSIPVQEFLSYTSYLVYKEAHNAPFILDNKGQNEKNVELGPFYLIWDNIKHPELKEETAAYWPYQVVGLDLIRFKQKFPKMSPPHKASVSIKQGFLAFRKHCLQCHTLFEKGGEKGPDLTKVASQYKEAWLKKFISDPRSLRPESKMNQLKTGLKDRDKIIDNIVAYLKWASQ